jgi:hypothetical protein
MPSTSQTPRPPSAVSQIVLLKETPAPTLPTGTPAVTIRDAVYPGSGSETLRQFESLLGKVVVLVPNDVNQKETVLLVTDACSPKGPLIGRELLRLDTQDTLWFASVAAPKKEFPFKDLLSIKPARELMIVPKEQAEAYLVQKSLHKEYVKKLQSLQPATPEVKGNGPNFLNRTVARIAIGTLAIGVGALLLTRHRESATKSFEERESNRLAAVRLILSGLINRAPGANLTNSAYTNTQQPQSDLNALKLPSVGSYRSLTENREQINNLSFKRLPNVTNEASLAPNQRQALVAQSDAWFSEAASIYLSLRDDIVTLRNLLELKAGAKSFTDVPNNGASDPDGCKAELAKAVVLKSMEAELAPPVVTSCSVRPSVAPEMASNWPCLTTTVLTRMAIEKSFLEDAVVETRKSPEAK